MSLCILVKNRPVGLAETFDILDVIDGKLNADDIKFKKNRGYTQTRMVEYSGKYALPKEALDQLHRLWKKWKNLYKRYTENEDAFYNRFTIPKKTGGVREIDSPNEEMRKFQKDFVRFINKYIGNDYGLHHTAAYAYIKHRNTKAMQMVHKMNNSYWYGKIDLHNFFNSITPTFVLRMLEMIVPFKELVLKDDFVQLIRLCFYHGGLPQGALTSPMLSNLVMIPFDYYMSNYVMDALETKYHSNFVYTRYADDMEISSKVKFSIHEIEEVVNKWFTDNGSDLTINEKKTRIGSRAGHNVNVGLVTNKDNELTVGWRKINECKLMLFNYFKDKQNGKEWDWHKIEQMKGLIRYWKYIQPERISEIIKKYEDKFGMKFSEI